MSAADTPRLPATFNRLAWSNLAAQSAEQIALAAAPIVAVLLLGVGEGQTGLLQTALTLPFILFAIPAGLLADRISRRWVMAGSEALRAAALAGILLLIWLDQMTLALLSLLGFIAVCGTVAYSVAAPALEAHRAGLTDVIVPSRNEGDLDDVPEAIREVMTIHLASDVRQVLDWALEPAAPGAVAAA